MAVAAEAVAARVAAGAASSAAASRAHDHARTLASKSPRVGQMDIALVVALVGFLIVVYWLESGRWDRLKKAYTG